MDEAGRDITTKLQDVFVSDPSPPPPSSSPVQHAALDDNADVQEEIRGGDVEDEIPPEEPPSELEQSRPSWTAPREVQEEREERSDDGSGTSEAGFEPVSLEEGQQDGGGWRSMPVEERRASASPALATSESPTPPLSGSASTTPATTAHASESSSKATFPSAESISLAPSSFEGAVSTSTEAIAVVVPAATTTYEDPPRKSLEVAKQPRLGTHTPSMMQKVLSLTRQRDLPPKSKEEEKKHLRELEEMRTASKDAEKRRKSRIEASAAARATKIATALPTWETSILPNWRSVLHPNAEGLALRKLWWSGTMPVRWRGRLWGLCVGNGLAVSKNSFTGHLARARKGVEDGSFPVEVMKQLEDDVERTLPTLKLFQKGGVMHEELVDLLLAYTVYANEQPRYPSGLSCPAAMLLVNMPIAEAFLSLANLVSKSFLKSFYSAQDEEVEAYFRIFDTLLADSMPKIYENFSKEVVRPSLYLFPWLTTLYVRFLPLDLSTRLFDVFLLEGDSFLFRVALVLLQILEPRLFNPVQSELDAVFKGEDRGAIAVVRREKADEHDEVRVEEVYAEMGCTEERIFELLGKMEWKEETWERLVSRELPEAD